jgi:hypothetical protein
MSYTGESQTAHGLLLTVYRLPFTRGYASNIRLVQESSLTCNNLHLLEQET